MSTPTRTRPAVPMLASQAVLLRPRWKTVSQSRRERWPILVIVVDERADADAGAQRLFEHLDSGGGPVMPGADECHWSVRDHRTALLGLTLRTDTPVSTDLTVIVPAAGLARRPDFLQARTVALTTARHAGLLTPGFDLRSVLRHLVLVGPLPTELAELASPARLAHRVSRTPDPLHRIPAPGRAVRA